MYKKIILPILFLIDPEKVHNIIFSSLKILLKVPFVKLLVSKVYLIEVNDNPSIEYGVEDAVEGFELYQKIMKYFFDNIDS